MEEVSGLVVPRFPKALRRRVKAWAAAKGIRIGEAVIQLVDAANPRRERAAARQVARCGRAVGEHPTTK